MGGGRGAVQAGSPGQGTTEWMGPVGPSEGRIHGPHKKAHKGRKGFKSNLRLIL